MESADYRSRVQTICLMVITFAVGTYVLYWLRPVLLPFVVALFVVSGVTPILRAQEARLGVSRMAAAAITFLAGLLLLLVLGLTISASIQDLNDNATDYRQRIADLIDRVENDLPAWLIRPAGQQQPPPNADVGPQAVQVHPLGKLLEDWVRTGLANVSQVLVSMVSSGMIVLIYVFFLLLGSTRQLKPGTTTYDIDQQVRSFIALKTLISAATGLAFGLFLQMVGVPMAITFGMLAFLLNFIPNIGPIIATVLPVPLILLQPDASLLWMIAVISISSAIQVISGNVVEPRMMGHSSDLHPVVILLALMFWGMLWGIAGMFLATPITAGVKIVFERIEATRPLADVMAGRWSEVKIS